MDPTAVSSTLYHHLPVLPNETVSLLRPENGGTFVDGTLGFGGHARLLLDAGATRLIGIDQDHIALEYARTLLGSQAVCISGNFSRLRYLLKPLGIGQVAGILLDIGVSSMQLDDEERGFSFRSDGPLDMRMNLEATECAADLVNSLPEAELADILFRFGEERLSRRIAKLIVDRRRKLRFERTADLAEVVTSAYPPSARFKHPHPATRTFQALRIAVNDELSALEQGISQSFELLAPGGVLAIISFHSLEDRIVKNAFRLQATERKWNILTKRPMIAGDEERQANPRSRSAKLRAIERPAVLE